jgi:hypothetical protein
LAISAVSDILHFGQAFFVEFRAAYRQNLVHDQDLVCSHPGSQSPAGLPAAAYLGVPSASVRPSASPKSRR